MFDTQFLHEVRNLVHMPQPALHNAGERRAKFINAAMNDAGSRHEGRARHIGRSNGAKP